MADYFLDFGSRRGVLRRTGLAGGDNRLVCGGVIHIGRRLMPSSDPRGGNEAGCASKVALLSEKAVLGIRLFDCHQQALRGMRDAECRQNISH